jgi:nucleolar protein 14
VSLAAENRMKLAAFFGILLKEYMRTDDMSCQDVIARHLFEMANKYFEQAAVDECAKQVQKIHARITERNCVLSINESMFIALVARLFSATDFRHKIVTPALLVLGQSLSQCAISHPVDLVHGLFSCSVMVNVLRPVKRYAPELLTFIEGVLSLLVKGKADPACLRSTVPAESVTLVDASKKDLAKAAKSDLTSFRQLLSDASADEWSLSTRVQVMTLALQVADSYLVVLANLSPLPEMCQSFMDLVEAAPAALQAMPSVSKVRNAIQKRAGDALAVRQPLRMQTFAPKSIKMLNPKFEESFKATKDHDPDRERARVKKLQREVKDAKKNAMRELQRDAEFMAEERRKRKRDLDDREAQVVRNVNTILEQQQQMANTLDRMVKKPRRQ